MVIMGPSGGKTTLLSLLGGLDRPQSGEIILDGQQYGKLSENSLARLRRIKLVLSSSSSTSYPIFPPWKMSFSL